MNIEPVDRGIAEKLAVEVKFLISAFVAVFPGSEQENPAYHMFDSVGAVIETAKNLIDMRAMGEGADSSKTDQEIKEVRKAYNRSHPEIKEQARFLVLLALAAKILATADKHYLRAEAMSEADKEIDGRKIG